MRTTRRTRHLTPLVSAWIWMLLAGTVAAQGLRLDRDTALELLTASDRWAEVEGELQENGVLLAKELDMIHPEDFANMDELGVTGTIAKLDRRRSQMQVLQYRIVWDAETKIKDVDKKRILSSKLENGIGIKIKGQPRPDGSIYARSIRVKEGKMKDGVLKYKDQLKGPVEVLDAREGLLRIVDTEVRLRADCEFYDLPVEVDPENP